MIAKIAKDGIHVGPAIGKCSACGCFIYFLNDKLVFPRKLLVSAPNPDMPENCKADYEEARAVYNDSPRAAGALLRLALQRLMVHLGEDGKNINADIGKLVSKGLPENVQKAMDVLRITGNSAVHPGEIRDEDMPEEVARLFKLLNFIVENRITEPQQLKSIYDGLPQSKKDAIDKRDGK